jgi:hypothetical protein
MMKMANHSDTKQWIRLFFFGSGCPGLIPRGDDAGVPLASRIGFGMATGFRNSFWQLPKLK